MEEQPADHVHQYSYNSWCQWHSYTQALVNFSSNPSYVYTMCISEVSLEFLMPRAVLSISVGGQSGGSMVAVLSSAARRIAGRESMMGGRWE